MRVIVSPVEAIVLSFLFSLFFVLSLYIWLPFEKYLNKLLINIEKVQFIMRIQIKR
jgi:hypothetical protein